VSNNIIFDNDLFLAIDQGGHASRAIVFNHKGEVVAEAFQNIAVTHPESNRVEHDATELIASIRTVITDVARQLGDKVSRLTAAGLATQRSSIACWNKDTGEGLYPVISWQDVRAHKWLQQFKPHADHIHKKTGLFLSAHYGASKINWCLNNIKEVQAAQADNNLCTGPMASFIIYNLLEGQPYLADPGNASRTQLWNIHTKTWDPELLALFGVAENLLPKCVPSKHEFGMLNINDDIQIPLTLVTGDQSAAMYAYGKIQSETAYINTGTGAFISRPSGYALLFGRRLLTSIIYQQDEQAEYVLEGTVNGAGSAIDYMSKELNVANVFSYLSDWLDTHYKKDFQQLFINGVSGLGAPFWIADFPVKFSDESSNEEKFVAVVESIIFLLQASIEEMQKFASHPEQLQITGGLAQMDGLCQRLADLSGLPVYRPVECEATARGLAYLLLNKPKKWPETKTGDWFKPDTSSEISTRYKRWYACMLEEMRQ